MSHCRNALTDRFGNVDCITEAAATHHVAALLIVRIGIEQIVGDVLEHFFQPFPCHRHAIDLRIGDRRGVVDVFHCYCLAGQNARAPAKSGRQGDLCIALLQKRRTNQVIKRSVEIAAAEKHGFSRSDGARKIFGKWRARFRYRGTDLRIRFDRVRKQRDEFVAEVFDRPALHIEIEPRQELAVAAGSDQQCVARPL